MKRVRKWKDLCDTTPQKLKGRVIEFIENLRKEKEEGNAMPLFHCHLPFLFLPPSFLSFHTLFFSGVYDKALFLRDLFQETDLIRRLHNGNVTMNNRADFVGQVIGQWIL